MSPELPLHEILRLKQAATGRSRRSLLVDPELSAEEGSRFSELVRRRLDGEPLQYLEGSVSFGGLEIAVDRRALIPRPETEELFELAASLVEEPDTIVDLCTGSGNLALALKYRFPAAEVFATDISDAALALAAENAARLGLDVHYAAGDLFAPLPEEIAGTVGLIVANPPYVGDGDELPLVVRDHEPPAALFAGADGLDVVRRIAAEAGPWLAVDGAIAVEVGSAMAEEAGRLFAAFAPDLLGDMHGQQRFVVGRKQDDPE